MATRGTLSAVADKKRPRPRDLRDEVEDAITYMTGDLGWLKPADQGLVALARKYADEIERTVDRAEELEALWESRGADRSYWARLQKLEAHCDVVRVIGWLGPQLQGVLKELGGSMLSRRAMEKTQPIGGRLDELKRGLPNKRGAEQPGTGENQP